MKVTLISHTQDAENILLFTKSTRLNMSPAALDEIRDWPQEKKLAELQYMANTIPSSWEMVDYIFMIEGVSRAFTHQFVRNRHGSYAQQSLRVIDAGDYEYVATKRNSENPAAMKTISELNISIQAAYAGLRDLGQSPEDARGVLPTNIATNIVAKFNLRTMSELAKSRTGGRTQGEYINVMDAMCTEVVRVHPWAEQFLFPIGRDYFAEIEAFAEREYAGDLLKKGELLKIVDKMRKGEG